MPFLSKSDPDIRNGLMGWEWWSLVCLVLALCECTTLSYYERCNISLGWCLDHNPMEAGPALMLKQHLSTPGSFQTLLWCFTMLVASNSVNSLSLFSFRAGGFKDRGVTDGIMLHALFTMHSAVTLTINHWNNLGGLVVCYLSHEGLHAYPMSLYTL
jgi:hypothetical protein